MLNFSKKILYMQYGFCTTTTQKNSHNSQTPYPISTRASSLSGGRSGEARVKTRRRKVQGTNQLAANLLLAVERDQTCKLLRDATGKPMHPKPKSHHQSTSAPIEPCSSFSHCTA